MTNCLKSLNLYMAESMRDSALADMEAAEKLIATAKQMAEESATRWQAACRTVERIKSGKPMEVA